MSSEGRCLIIFTRYPESGKAKTRLIPALGGDRAANLQRLMSERAISEANKLQSIGFFEVEIHYAGGNSQLMSDWLGKKLIYQPQNEGDLGHKMSEAFTVCFKQGYQSVVIIGTDCPNLDANILKQAFGLLEAKDLVLGAALDGGYYLIGLHRLVPDLFTSIEWSTSTVCDRTVEIATKLGLNIGYLPSLFDIDRPEDLELLKDNPIYQQVIGDRILTE